MGVRFWRMLYGLVLLLTGVPYLCICFLCVVDFYWCLVLVVITWWVVCCVSLWLCGLWLIVNSVGNAFFF